MDSPRNSSSDEDYSREDLVVEIYSRGNLDEVTIASQVWTLAISNIIEFINRRILRGDIDFPIFIEMILTRIVQATKSEFGSISIKEKNSIKCIALGENKPGTLRSTGKMNESVFYSLHHNKAIISNSVSLDPRITRDHPESKTLLVIPIRGKWVLSLSNKKKYKASDIQEILPVLYTLGRILKQSNVKKETILERTSRDKEVQNKFLAAMSHDLRTPLNGILGMVTLLPDAGSLSPKQKEYLTAIKECTFQMVTLVNNFLDFNKMASESLVLKKEPMSIEKVVVDSLGIVRGGAVNKGLTLLPSQMPPNMPIVLGDSARLTQILSNLLSNAVKFTNNGSIGVSVNLEPIKDKLKIIFQVKDTGIGIPQDDRDRIFEFFKQSSNLNAFLSRSGTGFGLSFSRELVHLMGGEIWVESDVGQGSTFTFFIILEEEIQVPKKNNNLKGIKVLVVDDRIEMRIQLSEILFKWGCYPTVLGSAKEALSYLNNDQKFDLGIIDICMPHMSGVELAQSLRQSYPHIPLIGLSSSEIAGGEEYFDFYAYKPINPNQLLSMAVKCFRTPIVKKRRPRKTLKILIAEDNKYNSYTLKELLSRLGYARKNIKIVADGKLCVEEVKRNRYDVILMDIVMPVMSGIEAAIEIQKLSNPPTIIAVSAAVMNSDKTKCQEVGISAYLEKPISIEKLDGSLLPLVSRKKDKRTRKKKKR